MALPDAALLGQPPLTDAAAALANAPHAVVHRDPEIMGGTPVFVGTRVPVDNLIDDLEAGDGLERFLDHFPTVRPEQAVAALMIAREMLRQVARAHDPR
jgi:uncharacterized protein (DUF433 family)